LRSPAQVSVCKLPVPEGETTTVTILAHGYDPQVSQWNPFHGAVYAILEAVAKVVAAGGDFTKARLSLQEYFERLGEDPEQWGKPFAALLGALYAQRMTGVPAIGGKDSMSGSFKDLHVPPVVAAFALCPGDARRILTPDFQRPGRRVVLCSPLRGKGVFGCEFPNGHRLRFLYRSLGELIAQGRVTAARAVTGGGVCEAISKLCFGNGIGFRFETALPPAVLYGPGYGGLVLELAEDAGPGLFLDLPCEPLGRTCPEKVIEIDGVEIPLEDCLRAWGGTLEGVFPTRPAEGGPQAPGQAPTAPERVSAPAQGGTARRGGRAKGFSGKPRVLIPVFPGTNGETDLARAFRRAGAVTEELVFHNLTPQGVAESLCRLERALGACQILGLPGGFSAGDEPDGAAKFIAVVLRSQGVAEAVTDLLERRDGLILGICNGFQALVKVGLLPGGVLGDLGPRAPTLTHNTIGRHISRVAFTRVVSVQSPWMAGVQVGDIHGVAISHGEGRFAAEEAELDRLFAQGQVAAVYWGDNPNGAQGAVEALTSPCGRVLGKMGHSERTGDWLYKNVPGNFDQKIFESGVNYFV
jgi:phosphoribosylformylglycinamidine synthase